MEGLSRWTLTIGLGIYLVGIAVSQSLMSLGSTILCVLALVLIGRLRERSSVERRVGALVIILVLWNFTTLVLRVSRGEPTEWQALETLPLIAIPLLAVLATEAEISFLRSERVYPKLVALAALGFFLSTAYACFQGFIEGRMAIAWLRNPIYLSYNLLFPLVLIASLVPKLEKKQQLRALGFVSLFLLAILATNSRMVLALSLLMTGLLLGRWLLARIAKVWILVAILAFAGLAIHEYTSKDYVRARFAAVADTSHPSTQGRLRVWAHNIGLIAEHPIAGVGYKQNALLTRNEDAKWQALWGANVAIYAHNIYLQATAESGVVGLVLLIAVFVAWLSIFPASWPIVAALAIGGLTENVLTNSKQLHSLLGVLLVAGLWKRFELRRTLKHR